MAKLLVLIHTVPPLLNVFDRLGAELLPGVKPMHILDEPLLERIRQRGHLAPEDSEHVRAHAAVAEQIGADAVLVTCSTISPCVDDVRSAIGIPVMKIDDAMIEQAVATGTRIGVIATNETTLEPTQQLLQAQAEKLGKEIQVDLLLVEKALSALMDGDGATHDRLVKEAVLTMMGRVDVVVLAQASMARVLDVIPEAERKVPILSSPHLALERVRRLLTAQ
ncbi:MAG: aspartate/glutamate racemase family protein [Anaerolineae bacterium]